MGLYEFPIVKPLNHWNESLELLELQFQTLFSQLGFILLLLAESTAIYNLMRPSDWTICSTELVITVQNQDLSDGI